ncbi:hypothetical protein HDV00_009023 [Rhizophlyctis rosea]|nr:hypothetical protein HDV00_009023 [Rhizophlyctis rosea]
MVEASETYDGLESNGANLADGTLVEAKPSSALIATGPLEKDLLNADAVTGTFLDVSTSSLKPRSIRSPPISPVSPTSSHGSLNSLRRHPPIPPSLLPSSPTLEPSTQTLSSLQRLNQISHGIIEDELAPVYDRVLTWEIYAHANTPREVGRSGTPNPTSPSLAATDLDVNSFEQPAGDDVPGDVEKDVFLDDISQTAESLEPPHQDRHTTPDLQPDPAPSSTSSPTTTSPDQPLLPPLDTRPLSPIDLLPTLPDFQPLSLSLDYDSLSSTIVRQQESTTVRKFHLPVAKHKYFESLVLALDDEAERAKMDPVWVEKLEEFRRSGVVDSVLVGLVEENGALEGVEEGEEEGAKEGEDIGLREGIDGNDEGERIVDGEVAMPTPRMDDGPSIDTLVRGYTDESNGGEGVATLDHVGRGRLESQGVLSLMDYYRGTLGRNDSSADSEVTPVGTHGAEEEQGATDLGDGVDAVLEDDVDGVDDVQKEDSLRTLPAPTTTPPPTVQSSSPLLSTTPATPPKRTSSLSILSTPKPATPPYLLTVIDRALDPNPRPRDSFPRHHLAQLQASPASSFMTPDHSPPRRTPYVNNITGPQLVSTSNRVKTIPIEEMLRGLQERGRIVSDNHDTSPTTNIPTTHLTPSTSSAPSSPSTSQTSHSRPHSRNPSENSAAFWDQIDEEAKREKHAKEERDRELKDFARKRKEGGGVSVKSATSKVKGVFGTLRRGKGGREGGKGETRSLHSRNGSREDVGGGRVEGDGMGNTLDREYHDIQVANGYGSRPVNSPPHHQQRDIPGMNPHFQFPSPPVSHPPTPGQSPRSAPPHIQVESAQGWSSAGHHLSPQRHHHHQQQTYITPPASPAHSHTSGTSTDKEDRYHTPRHTPKPSLSSIPIPPPHAPPSSTSTSTDYLPTTDYTPRRTFDDTDDTRSIRTTRTVRSVKSAVGIVASKFRRKEEEDGQEGRGTMGRKRSLPEGLLSFGWRRK